MVEREAVLVAIDVGTSKVVALIGEVNRDGAVTIIGKGGAPSSGLKKGVVINIDQTVNSIRTAREQAERLSGYRIESAIVGVGGNNELGLRGRHRGGGNRCAHWLGAVWGATPRVRLGVPLREREPLPRRVAHPFARYQLDSSARRIDEDNVRSSVVEANQIPAVRRETSVAPSLLENYRKLSRVGPVGIGHDHIRAAAVGRPNV